MVCRELRLPAGVSVLHVEQEVTGDNTLALDSVSSVTLRECSCLLERGSYWPQGTRTQQQAGLCTRGGGG